VVQEEVGRTEKGSPKKARDGGLWRTAQPWSNVGDFSQDFLPKLMQGWRYAWLYMTEALYDTVNGRVGTDTANKGVTPELPPRKSLDEIA